MKKGDTGGLCNFPKIIKWGWNGNPALTNYSAQIRGQEVKIKLTQILKSVTSDNLSGISGYEYYRLLWIIQLQGGYFMSPALYDS